MVDKLDKEKIYEFYLTHRGEVIGIAAGLVTSVLILVIGFFKVLFIAIFIALGYYIGKWIANDKDYLKNLLDRMLPPGTYR